MKIKGKMSVCQRFSKKPNYVWQTVIMAYKKNKIKIVLNSKHKLKVIVVYSRFGTQRYWLCQRENV